MAYEPIPRKAEDSAHANGDMGVPILGVRRDAETSPVDADGDYHELLFNEQGRLKTAGAPDIYAAVTGNIAGNGQTVSADVSGVSNIVMYVTGTFSTVNCTFEGSIDGGTTWFGIQAVRTNANTVETTTGNLSAAPAYAWELSVNALTNVRVRATAYTSGTQNWRFVMGSYATEPIPAIQTHAVTGSGNFAVTMAASATGSPAKAEDAAAASADVGVFALGVRRDGAITTAPTSATGDYSEIAVDNYGQLRVAAQARTTNPTAGADGNGIIPIYDKLGKQVVVGSVRDLKGEAQLTLTNTTTETTLIAAGGAGVFRDVYGLVITNISATATEVIIRDVTGAGTPMSFMVPAGQTVGFMLPESAAKKQGTANSTWSAKCETSVASIKINAMYVNNL